MVRETDMTLNQSDFSILVKLANSIEEQKKLVRKISNPSYRQTFELLIGDVSREIELVCEQESA